MQYEHELSKPPQIKLGCGSPHIPVVCFIKCINESIIDFRTYDTGFEI